MVDKNKVGNFQFLLGIILLIIAIVGIIIAVIQYNDSINSLQSSYEQLWEDKLVGQYEGEEMTDIEIQTAYLLGLHRFQIKTKLVITLALASLISFLMSILFITQGLVNKAQEIKEEPAKINEVKNNAKEK
jgi:uncharacterized membrane protein